MQRWLALTASLSILCIGALAQSPGGYPRTLIAQAQAKSGETSVSSTVTIKIDRLMEPSRRTRVLDGLKYNGYQGFMNALRPLPTIGTIATQNREVKVQYAWETKVDDRTRLVVAASKPLFFLTADETKSRAGYELTVVDLLLDARGTGTGTMSGAARVKPAPDGIVLDDFAAAPVQLTIAPPSK
ncbi:MAG TPA: hypothetical protein VKE51_30115 [Vicinamibacterales bacterium]|nr:hypothetical protein [Vicinamibacterales bacterium]